MGSPLEGDPKGERAEKEEKTGEGEE